jgi:hypothetical protein
MHEAMGVLIFSTANKENEKKNSIICFSETDFDSAFPSHIEQKCVVM